MGGGDIFGYRDTKWRLNSKYGSFSPKMLENFLLLSKSVSGYFKTRNKDSNDQTRDNFLIYTNS